MMIRWRKCTDMETILILTALVALLVLRTPVAFALGGLGVILLALKG